MLQMRDGYVLKVIQTAIFNRPWFTWCAGVLGCPIKPYATMPKGIIGNGGSWSLIEALGDPAT